jgi:hypothetical protein
MCTLIVFRNVFPGRPVVAAANRDERFSRPSAPPGVTRTHVRVLAPTDLERGGTWIGVNDRGLLVAITNRDSIPSVRGLGSRGELVREALACRTTEEAAESVLRRDPGGYNAFHLAIVDRASGVLIVGNGVGGTDVDGHDIEPAFRAAPLGEGTTIVTNLGCGPGSPRANAILRVMRRDRLESLPPLPGSLGRLLDLHAGEQPNASTYGRRLLPTCIHPTDDDPDYGTVSSAIVRLNDRPGGTSSWEYWHRDRPRERVYRCSSPWNRPVELPIRAA